MLNYSQQYRNRGVTMYCIKQENTAAACQVSDGRVKMLAGIVLFVFLAVSLCFGKTVQADSSKTILVQEEDGVLKSYQVNAQGEKTILKNVFLAIQEKNGVYTVTPPKASGSTIYRFASDGVGKKHTAEGFVKITYKDSVQKLYAKKGRVYTGWYKRENKRYYCVKGERVKGWKKINGKSYYFNSAYVLQQNKIVGSKASGYFYVDPTGVRITAPAVKAAVSFVVSNSKSSQSAQQRLKSCFNALLKYPYRTYYTSIPAAGKLPSYAEYMFQNRGGNCYCYAAAMAYIAKVLGFESRVAAGGVTAYAGRQLSPHGWCEVKIGSQWKMCDCSMQNAHKDQNLFLVTRKQYPFRLRCDKVFQMTAKNGKITWK